MAAPTGTTRVTAVIGDPVRHSLSPVILNAAFGAAGLDWVMVALPVAEGDAVAAVRGAGALGIRGLSVTMPHKAAVIDALDRLTDVARTLGAVNCIFRDPADDTLLVGHNTDGEGFLAGLRADLDLEVRGRECLVVGAGGAARAVVAALAGAGAAEVAVLARSPERAGAAAGLAGAAGRVLSREDEADALRRAALVVNATPVGMAGTPGLPVRVDQFGPGQVVVDLIYHPLRTELLERAAARGARTANGLSMLVHQAAASFTRWTGTSALVGAMVAAARQAVQPGPAAEKS